MVTYLSVGEGDKGDIGSRILMERKAAEDQVVKSVR